MVIRGALSILLVAALAGCSGLFGTVNPNGTVSALEKAPGVATVEASTSDQTFETQATLGVQVTTTEGVTRDEVAGIVKTWWAEVAKVDGVATLQIERPGSDSEFELTTWLSTETAVAAATEWFDLSEVVTATTEVSSVVETRIPVEPGGPASVLAVLGSLDLVPSSERVVVSSDDTTFTSYRPVSDATAVTALEALQLPFAAAGEYGSITIDVTQATPIRVRVDLDPDALRNTPGNEVSGLFPNDPMYGVVRMVLDAVPASTGAQVDVSVFGRSVAALDATECTSEGVLSADLWSYWGAC